MTRLTRSMFRRTRRPARTAAPKVEALETLALPAPFTGAGGMYSPALGTLSTAEQVSVYNAVYGANTVDVRVANGTLFITGTPLDDNVEVANDSTVNSTNSAQGSRSQTVDANAYSRVEFNGGGGNDSFVSQSNLKPVLARGGDASDTLVGGAVGDTLIGDLGADNLNGRGGNDVAWGDGQGQISGTAPDGANGSTMTDTLRGEDGDDALYGGFGNDSLYGGNNNDILNGGDQDDFLEGGAGIDTLGQQGYNYTTYTYFPIIGWIATGVAFAETASENGNDRLFGGANDGADVLRGGAGADRLIAPADRNGSGGLDREDSFPDFATEDARPTLVDGYAVTVTLSGVVTNYTAKNWTDADVNRTDAVFGVLQANANGKTTLLERANGGDLVIVRHGTANRGYNEGGTNWIHMTDMSLQYGDTSTNDVNLRGYILHEIGHNWQGSAFASNGTGYWGQFVAQSGWTSTNPNSPAYTLSTNEGNGNRWYLNTATFASGYARTNENEDFAESFAAYFTQRAGWTYYNGGAGAANIAGKITVFSNWAAGL